MTLKRLMLILGILVVLAGVGIAWLWQYAYSPEGRARVIIAQFNGDTTSLRGRMLQNHLIRPGYTAPPNDEPTVEQQGLTPKDIMYDAEVQRRNARALERKIDAATNEMVKLGHEVLPIMIETMRAECFRWDKRLAVRVCGKLHDPVAIEPIAKCLGDDIRATGGSWNEIQFECVNALVDFGPVAYGPLMEDSRNSYIRQEIPAIIAEKWGQAAVPYLIEMIDDSDHDTRRDVAGALEKLGVKPPAASQSGKP